MKMAILNGKIWLNDLAPEQIARIKSWNCMKWSRQTQMMSGELSLEILDRLAKMVHLPPAAEEKRQELRRIQKAVDRERNLPDPAPLASYPVKKKLYSHQVRAANMALLVFEAADPARVLGSGGEG